MNKKTIIVTGASGALGTATVKTLLNAGHQLITLDRTKTESNHERLDRILIDLTSDAAVSAAVEQIKSKYQTIDAVVMIAGGFSMGDLQNTTTADIGRMLQINFYSAFHISKAVFALMKQQKQGNLVFIGAKPALESGSGGFALAYSLSKRVLIEHAAILDAEGRRNGVRSYVIAPSIIDTTINREAMPDADFSQWVKPERIAQLIQTICENQLTELADPILRFYGNS